MSPILRLIVALVAGIVFGVGLTISDMVNPARVLNFLDVAGSWDPTLAAVMGGGLLVAIFGYRFDLSRRGPLLDVAFHLPTKRDVDLPLIVGSSLFGLGWGLAGICPGPAFADLVTLDPRVVLFVLAMLLGMLTAAFARGRLSLGMTLRARAAPAE